MGFFFVLFYVIIIFDSRLFRRRFVMSTNEQTKCTVCGRRFGEMDDDPVECEDCEGLSCTDCGCDCEKKIEEKIVELENKNKDLEKEIARLQEEIKEPRCHDCNTILGDNWCSDCANKVYIENLEKEKSRKQS